MVRRSVQLFYQATVVAVPILVLSACKFGLVHKTPTDNNRANCVIASDRAVAAVEMQKPEPEPIDCHAASSYRLEVRRFSSEVPRSDAPERGSRQICVLLGEETECLDVEELVFGTLEAKEADPEADQHPQDYDNVEYRATVATAAGEPALEVSEVSTEDALARAVARCGAPGGAR